MALAEVQTARGERVGESELRAAIAHLASHIQAMTPKQGLALCSVAQTAFEAAETALLAQVVADDDGDERRASRMARRRGTSKRESRKRARRGKAVATNPSLGDQLADGSLSGEELDLLAVAAAKSDDEALFDDRLITRVGAAGPDQGKRVVRDWLNDRESADTVEEKYKRERAHRSIWCFTSSDGIPAIGMAGDEAFRDAVWARAQAGAERLYRDDGGRDIPVGKHPRTYDQRMFDAFAEMLMGSGGDGASGAKPTVVVTVSLDKLVGDASETCAAQVGTGPIADAVLAKYLAHGDLVAMLFGSRGQPLWLGRKRRDASRAQHLALTVRDKGCVLCAAPAHRCQAHHVMPWNAPGKGRTDIDQLVLLCGSCHQGVHQDKVTVIRDQGNQCWTTRSATPNEIAPDRPSIIQRE